LTESSSALLDVLHPAPEAFAAGLTGEQSLVAATAATLAAGPEGRDRVTAPRQDRPRRLPRRTDRRQVDPRCEFAVVVLTALGGP
jgi:hypothetical protein